MLTLLREADFNPDAAVEEEQLKSDRDRDYAKIEQLRSIWGFWKRRLGTTWQTSFSRKANTLMHTVFIQLYGRLMIIRPGKSP